MNSAKVIFRFVCVSILVLAVAQILFLQPSEANDDAHAPAASKEESIEQRERDVEEREARIKDREKELERKIVKMEELRQAVTGELEQQRKNNEDKVAKMVSVFETMSPKSAAGVFETLDDWLAIEVMKKMEVKRVAKIMNLMDKTRSAKLSELLTGYYKPEADRKISSVTSKLPNASESAVKKQGQVAAAPAAVEVKSQGKEVKKE